MCTMHHSPQFCCYYLFSGFEFEMYHSINKKAMALLVRMSVRFDDTEGVLLISQ